MVRSPHMWCSSGLAACVRLSGANANARPASLAPACMLR
jgi:hypothetical protein